MRKNGGQENYRKASWVMLANDVGNAPERLLLLSLLHQFKWSVSGTDRGTMVISKLVYIGYENQVATQKSLHVLEAS